MLEFERDMQDKKLAFSRQKLHFEERKRVRAHEVELSRIQMQFRPPSILGFQDEATDSFFFFFFLIMNI